MTTESDSLRSNLQEAQTAIEAQKLRVQTLESEIQSARKVLSQQDSQIDLVNLSKQIVANAAQSQTRVEQLQLETEKLQIQVQ